MTLLEKIKIIYPQLIDIDFDCIAGTIILQNNSDGKGDYIAKWEHVVFSLPTQQQIDDVK